MTDTDTQRAKVAAHLKLGRSLTHRDAQDLFNCDRLGARIHELREDGWHIETVMESNASGKRYARYALISTKGEAA